MNRCLPSYFSRKIHCMKRHIAPQFSSSVCIFELITGSESVHRVVHVIVLDNTVFLGQVVHKFPQTTATQSKVWNWLTKKNEFWYIKPPPPFEMFIIFYVQSNELQFHVGKIIVKLLFTTDMTIGLWFINFYYCKKKLLRPWLEQNYIIVIIIILCKNWFLIHSLDET